MKIEVWSDVVCPWCYIGKRNLEIALEDAKIDDAEIVFRSFELDMGMKQKVDLPLDVILARKYRTTPEQAQNMIDRVTEAANDVGLEFALDKAQTGNTYNAHRLIHFARTKDLGTAMKERLMLAYFCEGKPISEVETLVDLAHEIGLDRDDAKTVLEGTAFGQAVRDEEAQAMEQGVRGVPFFVIDGKFALNGAQPPQAFLEAFNLMEGFASGEVCDVDGC